MFNVCLKANSATGETGCFNDRIGGCGGCYNLHGLRVTRKVKIQVPCFTPWCRQLHGSCHFTCPQSQSVLVLVCLRRRARWLIQRASAVCPMLCIEVLGTTVACMFSMCVVLRRVRNAIHPFGSQLIGLCCVVMSAHS